jgi:hypothetical protein
MKTLITLLLVGILFETGFSQKTAEEWRAIIDTTWGEGLPTETKLQIFDDVHQSLDSEFGCFHGLDINMDSLRNVYRPEIEAGVSRGRFAAIMNYFVLAFKEGHNVIADELINFNNYQPPEPGVPLLAIGCWTDNSHFGATLTPLTDSSLLVIKTLPDHPLGLVPGDIVLGYDGIPWKRLYKDLLAAQLPFFNAYAYPSNEKSFTHAMLKDAGMNWHLFDTLDVMKYGTEDTMHHPTSLLAAQSGNISGSEQIQIPGVPFPDINWQGVYWLDVYDQENFVSWGIVDNTNIGYIYVYSWVTVEQRPSSDVANQYYQAIDTLMNHYKVEGLILDNRFDFGFGDGKTERQGFSLLFNSQIETFALDQRCSSGDHFDMCPYEDFSSEITSIYGDPQSFFDRPIAVLTGPGAFSAGDLIPFKLRFHPMVRTFGKPTSGAFSGTKFLPDPASGWMMILAFANAYPVNDPGQYLSRSESHVDEEIWLTRDDVANGEDTVVKRAIEWIQNLSHAHDVAVDKLYVESQTDSVSVNALVENPNEHQLSVMATIRNPDSTITDQISLYDDGLHGDGNANDKIWGNFYMPAVEQSFKISVTTDDQSDETSRTLPNVAWFTSTGPVEISSYQIALSDTIPNHGDQLQYKFNLKNNGSVTTTSDISIRVTPLDTCTSIKTFSDPVYGDIDPGVEVEPRRGITITFNPKCSDSILALVNVDIYSGEFKFWSDTLSIFVHKDPLGFLNNSEKAPLKFALEQNYPNPFNPTTMINYQLPRTCDVELNIYNLLGQEVATLVNKRQQTGMYQIEWDATGFSSGVYYYRIEAGNFVQTRKMIYLK